ncbi:MAG TPA: Rrf2 family transcriptional regulator [Polyangiaceae bacterium]|jgi:Rrf2 family nitric oxide-sensitive transcriptional repressor|nr:Rrf2 family transcriptional regulator [Polyangiaceae bacterium]
MQLTVFTDYTLRTLIYLGTRPGEIVPASAISAAYGISPDHIAKAGKWLTQNDYVNATRGKGGGLVLARAPKAIRIGAVVRGTEPHFDLLECFDAKTNTCPLNPACALKTALVRARDAFLTVLDGYTLADILGNRTELVRLLGRPSQGARA